MTDPSKAPADANQDAEMARIVEEEERVLTRVHRTLAQKRTLPKASAGIDYDAELIALRDQIRDARMEDIPPLVEEMERLQQVALRRAKVTHGMVDGASPYFGRLVLEEGERRREVLIGRSTFLDPKTGIRIVDWRDAPVSRVYYRYEEGDDYEEIFGNREVEGEILVRRTLSIQSALLKRIGAPQGSFQRRRDNTWRRLGQSAIALSGGQGAAMRPESHHRPGQLGVGDGDEREDKTLAEITALIDPRQFELISRPTSGVVVIQGGAGSGKTTIGLHRLAYLAFQDPKRFRPDKMLVVVFNDALVRYISRVLPALGVEGVHVVTYEHWAETNRRRHFPDLPRLVSDETPTHVTRLKKHPSLMALFDRKVDELAARVNADILDAAKTVQGGRRPIREWEASEGQALTARLLALRTWLEDKEGEAAKLPLESRHAVGRVVSRSLEHARDVVGLWAEVLTDRTLIAAAFADQDNLSEQELSWAHSYCVRRCSEAVTFREARLSDDEEEERVRGVDGADEAVVATLDREDDALLLHLYQRMVGPLRGKKRAAREYEHVFMDEAQDLSPVEMSVVLGTVTEGKSITFAGDVAQRLHMDNGFTDWKHVLAQLGLSHVEVEPLKLSYRSTAEIIDFATDVLGPLRNEVTGQATRHGAPVELFRFGDAGEAVGFLSEAVRNLVLAEPLASIAIIARYPEQADIYYQGMLRGEVPNVRRIAQQDFPFKPGVDVTDVRQVKGLEFDYVVLVECGTASYPQDDEARHLLHIASTRAAHQLWVISIGTPSMLLPQALRDQVG